MTLALCALSHSPLYGISNPGAPTLAAVDCALDAMRGFVKDFAPELTIVFGPDHFNGVFYDMMPPFCIGAGAQGVGDWGTSAGPLPVDREAARQLVRAVLDGGLDIAQSERLQVDHGIVQPLDFLFGSPLAQPIVPVFINSVGLPLGPVHRIRLLGELIGREAATWNKRVLLIGSGGLSHDPPVPRFDEALPEVRARLIDGRNPTAEMRALRQQRVIEAGQSHAAGGTAYQPVNPVFDNLVLDVLASGDLRQVDGWSNDWIQREGGHSGHEIRAWIAAFAALSAVGPYRVTQRSYWPVKEWMTGFALTCAISGA